MKTLTINDLQQFCYQIWERDITKRQLNNKINDKVLGEFGRQSLNEIWHNVWVQTAFQIRENINL
jgi:hypothetical protein